MASGQQFNDSSSDSVALVLFGAGLIVAKMVLVLKK